MSVDAPTKTAVTCVDSSGRLHQVPTESLTWRPSAYGIVIKDNHLLVCQRRAGYDLPGGRLILGETSDVAVIRETREETGIVVNQPRLVGLNNSFFKFIDSDDEPDVMHCIMLYYRCNYVGGDFTKTEPDGWEHLHHQTPAWYPLDQLSDMTVASSQDFRPLVEQALAL